ncbi:TonB-dependent receptor [Beijerinckiaceae bacterium RH AL1]|nr:TonB-dependent receptor [Beijerinckiaceae bacterium]VVB42367.1 TonB-dependent receptor [Beijerinckiaceae bacterium RH AL8]VVB42368.1 TonB-dependent receptor [Beijerinckiaceae bacterium RH CH11]VVC53273.1 TonB-dependent receptor [Beijerinckiaceae bacterium RH AL1]
MKIDTRTAVAGATLILAAGPLAAGAVRAQSTINLPEIEISQTPVPTSANAGLDVNKVPADVSTVTAHDFEVQYKPSVADAITARVPGAIAINVDGSDLSPDLFYRGFDVSRISGTSQGLAVYENGVRINEAFGDLVNLDLIPPIAIARSDIYTNNPIFGLNALGGAINFTTKNGFNFHGGDFTILGGSYGRVNGYGEYGKQSGNYSFYVAFDGYRDGGYRPFGAQNAQRVLADLGYRSQDSEMHLIGQYGRSLLGVQGVTPQVLVNKQYNSVFTSPQTTENSAGLVQLTGSYDVGKHWTLGSNFYVRQFDQYHVDGNDADVEDCGGRLRGTLCLPADNAPANATKNQRVFLDQAGNPIASLRGRTDDTAYGTTAQTATHTTSEGAQLQAVNKDTYYGHDNYFVAGASVDNSDTHFSSTTSLGLLNSAFQNQFFGVPGAGDIINTRGNVGFNSSFVSSNATYFGVFALDTFNVTKALAVTAGARFNVANISLTDLSGSNANLDSMHNYDRINPVFGLTYTFSPALTVYGGYSEANRAPTPLESECSNKFQPCILETALVSDPPLKQVVSHTWEGGVRGLAPLPASVGGGLAYKAGYFRTESDNDIVSEPSALSGQGFFVNAPETLRQGVEAGVMYDHGPWEFYANYAYIDARYEFAAKFASPNNPMANANGNIFVRPGDVIPGIPSQLGKIGLEYHVTPKWILGADTILVGSQYFVGDDANQNPKLPFYNVLNFHTSYQITNSIQVIGIINNVTNRRYATYGTYYDTGTSATNVSPTLAANDRPGGNADAVTVAQPLSVYGGVKVSF